MKNILLCLLLCLSSSTTLVFSQNIVGYTDILNRFFVFNDGHIQQVERQEVRRLKLGSDFVMYTDALSQLIRYKNRKKKIIDIVADTLYQTSRFLAINRSRNTLEVLYNDTIQTIYPTGNIPYELSDSLVVFWDRNNYFNIFEVGHLHKTIFEQVINHKLSDNTVAYTTTSDFFYLYHHGEIIELDSNLPKQYHAGNNFVTFINRFNDLMVYDDEYFETLEYSFVPKSLRVGNNFAAYVTHDDRFKLYWKEEVQLLSDVAPKSYKVIDNTMYYINNENEFHVFYKGKSQLLETFVPKRIEMFDGIVVYQDLDNRLKAFYEGEHVIVSEEIINEFDLHGRVILYTINNDIHQIYHDNKHYKHTYVEN